MADPTTFQFDLPADKRPARFVLKEKIHPRAWAAAPSCASLRGGDPLSAVRVIVIHATAGVSTSGAVSVMEEGRASFHWIVPDKDEIEHGHHVWATCPERLAAWHVRKSCSHPQICNGANNLNRASLGLEIVNRQDGEEEFSHEQIDAAAQIVRHAWAKYPNLSHVVSHARLDPNRRSDPGKLFAWEAFVSRILGS